MNLVIQDDEGKIIYGHEVLKRISQTGMTPEVNIVRGILPEMLYHLCLQAVP